MGLPLYLLMSLIRASLCALTSLSLGINQVFVPGQAAVAGWEQRQYLQGILKCSLVLSRGGLGQKFSPGFFCQDQLTALSADTM